MVVVVVVVGWTLMSRSPFLTMHAEEEQFQCRAAPGRHILVRSVSRSETVASEKGKPGVTYVMNSGSLRHGYGAWPGGRDKCWP